MNLTQLQYFIEVARQKNFTKAGEILRVTQPMITKTIKQLEDELDVQLIERTSKSFRLTDSGEILYEMALQIDHYHHDIYQRIQDLKSLENGNIRMSTPGVLLDAYFSEILLSFFTQHPHLSISIIEEGSKLTAQSVMDHQVDLGMVMLPIKNSILFEKHVVTRDVVHVLLPKDHSLAHRKSIHLKELKNERILTFSDTATLHDVFIAACEKQGFLPQIVYKSLMPNFSMDMVRGKNCVAILPAPIIQQYITDDLVSILIEPIIPWEIAIITKKDAYQSHAAMEFISFMRNYFYENQL